MNSRDSNPIYRHEIIGFQESLNFANAWRVQNPNAR